MLLPTLPLPLVSRTEFYARPLTPTSTAFDPTPNTITVTYGTYFFAHPTSNVSRGKFIVIITITVTHGTYVFAHPTSNSSSGKFVIIITLTDDTLYVLSLIHI